MENFTQEASSEIEAPSLFDCDTVSENTASIITEQRQLIHRLKMVINDLPGAIYWKDQNGVYLGLNSFSTETMKAANLSQSIIGKTDYDLFSKTVADHYRQHDLKVMQTGQLSSYEEKLTLNNGQVLFQLSYKRPLRDEQGAVVGIIGNTVDITDLKKIESELREAKNKVETLSHAKDEMIKHMEHDIRTPFNGIWVLANLLETQETDPEKKASLECIAQSAKGLLDYCNRLLEFIKAESLMLPVIEKKFNLRELFENIIMIEKVAAKSKNLSLTLEYAEDNPTIVMGDPDRVQRILLNLISNAIKFTEQGYVKVSVRQAKKINPKNYILYFVIEDSGVGMSAEKKNYVYERLDKVSFGSMISHQGYGLGLTVVKSLIKELGGEIDLKSQAGQGTQFICTLPFGIPLVDEILF